MFPRVVIALVGVLGMLATGCPLVIGGLAAAQPYYDRGDFSHRYASTSHAHATVGCVDVAPSLRDWERGVLLEWRMGNGCNQSVATNLSKLVVSEKSADGREKKVSLYDPVDEIRAVPLSPRHEAYEAIELMIEDNPSQICLDVGPAFPGAKSETPPLCFVPSVDGWQVDPGSHT